MSEPEKTYPDPEKQFDPWEWLARVQRTWPGPDDEKKIDHEENERRFK